MIRTLGLAAENAAIRRFAQVLLGLVVAVSNLDEVVAMIRSAANPSAARARLLAKEWPIGDIA